MKCDRRWWNDGRLERDKAAYRAWEARRPQWYFTTAPSGTSITLANPSDVQFFEVGMVLVYEAWALREAMP